MDSHHLQAEDYYHNNIHCLTGPCYQWRKFIRLAVNHVLCFYHQKHRQLSIRQVR